MKKRMPALASAFVQLSCLPLHLLNIAICAQQLCQQNSTPGGPTKGIVAQPHKFVVILGILPQTAQRHRHAPLQHPVQTGLGAVRFLKIVEKLLGGGG